MSGTDHAMVWFAPQDYTDEQMVEAAKIALSGWEKLEGYAAQNWRCVRRQLRAVVRLARSGKIRLARNVASRIADDARDLDLLVACDHGQEYFSRPPRIDGMRELVSFKAITATAMALNEDAGTSTGEDLPDFGASFPTRGTKYFSHFGEVRLADDQTDFPLEGEGVYLGGEYTLRVMAWPSPDDRRAILNVSTSEWSEWGIIRWPIEVTSPAAVAGACCAPRYGF